jgi:transcriptional regulator with XRE-family HTH domain
MAKDMTQEELADAARLSRATIAQIEGGDGDPRLSTLIDIATALEISPILLLMDERDLGVLVKMVQEGPDNLRKNGPSVSDVEQMRRLLETGLMKNRIRAAKIGVAAGDAVGAVGAAIGSGLFPGLGTVLGAIWAGRTLNGVIHETCPAKLEQDVGVLGYSSTLFAKVWFDCNSSSKTLKMGSREECRIYYEELKNKIGL